MIHLYSGNGKGKTTAAVGLAVRAAGAGLRVRFYQFLKNGSSSEIKVLAQISGISVRCCTSCNKFTSMMNDDEKNVVTAEHNEMLEEARRAAADKEADVIILDELSGAYNTGLLDRALAEAIAKSIPDSVELVITGREPAAVFRELAGYHSDIAAVKHPFQNGIAARKGIEY